MSATATSGTAVPTPPQQPSGGLGSPEAPSTWQRPAPDATGLRQDAIAALAFFAVSLLSMALQRAAHVYPDPAGPVLSVVVLAALTLPLAWRRRYPNTVLGVLTVAFIVLGEAEVPETVVTNVAYFLALYTVGAWESNRKKALVVRLVVVDVMFIWLLVSFFRMATDPPDGEDVAIGVGTLTPLAAYMLVQVLVNLLYFAGAIWFGNHAWHAAYDRHLLERRAEELQAERARVEEQAVTIERMRLARELHDAVAHHISLMGVQAAAARTLVDQDPGRAGIALERVEDSAREAIGELHTLLGTLRAEEDGATDAVGSLGVDRIPALVTESREAGMHVDYQVIGEEVALRPLASLNLYRIAQEALTNVRKHAGPAARVDMRLRYLPGAVELEVADDGSGRRRRPLRFDSGGLGLVGMRERVGADGGTLDVGPRREGGFLIRAQVPLTVPDDDAGPGGAELTNSSSIPGSRTHSSSTENGERG